MFPLQRGIQTLLNQCTILKLLPLSLWIFIFLFMGLTFLFTFFILKSPKSLCQSFPVSPTWCKNTRPWQMAGPWDGRRLGPWITWRSTSHWPEIFGPELLPYFVTYLWSQLAAGAAKSLQSCPTLWDPIGGSPTGSPVPGILQVRTLE